MKPLVVAGNRRYRSRLREEQAAATRDRIMEGVMRIFAEGVAGLSIPAVAREAGVSIPTVYRHYPTKRDLLDAVYPWSVRRSPAREIPPIMSIAEFRANVRSIFERLEEISDLERAAMASPGAEAVRAIGMDRRLGMARQAADALAPELDATDREHLARLVIVLTMSATARMLREHIGLTLDAAVDEVEWVVRAAIAGGQLGQART